MKKYGFTNETITCNGHKLHRIVALRNFAEIDIGELGGFIEGESNLSQDDDFSWIDINAKVYGDALVTDDARVYDYAEVYDNATICHRAQVAGCAKVFGSSFIWGDCLVDGRAHISGNARISGAALIMGSANISGETSISGDAAIGDNSVIKANTKITMGTYVDACIETPEMYVSISPFCAEQIPYAVFYKTTNKGICVSTPNFLGCVKDFVTFIKKNIKDAADKEKCLERLQVVNENYCKRFK